ncbi:putative metabolite transport protein YwtG [Bicyclus anynana]|uniref:Metabolite transport protein YwtG n=1 Tax=Bicyclus anynana TaxID=110368 RepID=A0ABM3M352_BICAN|nr:putative metabolite transport protein YwtG [Bicyclus anynana]
MVGFFFIPNIMQMYGRKIVFMGINFLAALGFLIFALSENVPCLFVARVVQGIPMCGVFITTMLVGEYTDSKRRGSFTTVKKSCAAIGSMISHSLALRWSWKYVAAFSVIPNTLALILAFLWPESPSFLALTGKYDECEKSHTWLFGDSLKSKNDLEQLVATQMERKRLAVTKTNYKSVTRKLFKKDFIKPFVIVSLITMLIDASGRYYIFAYVVQILIEVTNDTSIAAYCAIGSDLLTFVALLMSSFVIRFVKRRTLLFVTGAICASLMLLTSLITFVKSHYGIGGSIHGWLTPSVILLNVFIVNVGVVPAGFAIMCEIFPLEHKGTGVCASGIVFTVLYTLFMKCTPVLMEKTGVEGTFGIYALLVIVGLVILYFILNETKDKTLVDIEKEIHR